MMKRFRKLYKQSRYLDFKILSFKEQRRLRSLPRYQTGTTQLFGMEFHFVDAVTLLQGLNEIFKHAIYDFKPSVENPIILDCGANIGIGTLFFKRMCPKSKTIAFEPDQGIADVCAKNMVLHGFNDVEVVKKAIWHEETILTFAPEGGFSGRLVEESDLAPSVISVETVALRDYLDQPIEFLKMDIEGAEEQVMPDIADRLHNVKNLFIEYHSEPDKRQTLHEILKIVQEGGFRYQIHEAFVSPRPFVEVSSMVGMDLQLNIFAYRS